MPEQAPATVALDIRKAGVGPTFRPDTAIIMVVHNAAQALSQSLPRIMALTASCSELLIILDQCTDASHSVIVRHLGASFAESRLQRARVLVQPTPIWESACENLLMSLVDPLKQYILVQPDNIVNDFAWDLQLARPIEAFDDVFSVSGMLGHALGARTPTTHFLRGRPLLRDDMRASAPRATYLASRDHFMIRDTSSRGPLLLHAAKAQQLGFFHHEMYYLEDSDHEIHCRAGVLHGWCTGVVALSVVTENPALKTKTKGDAATPSEARNKSRVTLKQLNRRSDAMKHAGKPGCLYEQTSRLKQSPPRSEVRPLPQPAPGDACPLNNDDGGSAHVGADSERVARARAMMHASERAAALQSALGAYRFYVYEGDAFANMSSALPLPAYEAKYVGVPGVGGVGASNDSYSGIFAEYTAPVWVHRALLSDPARTTDPDEADVFFVPLYLAISHSLPSHRQRLANWLGALEHSRHFRRSGGADHIIAPQVVSREMAASAGLGQVRKLLEKGFTGAFEVNSGWTSGWSYNRTIVVPYVANPLLTPVASAFASLHEYATRNRTTSLFYVASLRDWSIDRAGCQRSRMRALETYPAARVKVAKRSQHLLGQDDYATGILSSSFCPLTCGDTPTSRRTFDAFAAGCIPIIVGTRMLGLCEPPCRNHGWFDVVGPSHPHLPFAGLWANWSIFPSVDEKQLYAERTSIGVHKLFRAAMDGLATQLGNDGGGAISAMSALRAHMYALRDMMIYGWGDYRTSTHFGMVARRMLEAALMRLRGTNVDLRHHRT